MDVHCHGGGGESFPNAETAEQAMVSVLEHRRFGTTSLVASCVTAAPEVLRARTRVLAGLCEDGELAGIHFEGPFVSVERCGAQDPTYIIDPDAALTRELIELGGGHVVTMTIAPEKPGITGDDGVNAALIEGGALPSFGHTDSEAAPVRAALADAAARIAERLEAGKPVRSPRSTATHLFNGMRPMHHRTPGPVPEFLAAAQRGECVLEMIGDGVHLSPAIVLDMFETLGRDNVVLVTDAMAAAGMADGDYVLGSQPVTVADGVARLTEGGAIAGGTGKARRFSYAPGLVVVDGGLPQVNAARTVLDELGIDVPLIGLAKRLEEVWVPGEEFPVILPRTSPALYLLQHLRDESHRFAITHHRKKRSAGMTRSVLDGIPGLGPARQAALLREFGSVTRIRKADVDDITRVKGIGPGLAGTILAHLNSPDTKH